MNVTRTTATNAGSQTSTASCSSVSGGQASCNNYSLASNTKAFTINAATLGTPSVTITKTGAVTWGAITNADSYQVKINDGSWAAATSGNKTIPTTTKGTHTAYVRAVGSGNYSTSCSGSASATISDKITVSWTKSQKECKGSYDWVYEETLYVNKCNGTTTMRCREEIDVGNALVTCDTSKWKITVTKCIEDEDDYPISCSESCPSTYTTTSTCVKKKKKTTTPCNCTWMTGYYKCSWGTATTTTVNADDCSTAAGSCRNGGSTGTAKVSCGSAYWAGAKSCSKTTYTTSSTNTPDQTSCKASSGFTTCNSSSVNKTNTSCFPTEYAKEVKGCRGTYSWGRTTTGTYGSCSSNDISCSGSTVGEKYVGCSRNYGCGSGTTAIGNYCINR